MLVPIILGSESDKPFAEKITRQLDEWNIPYKIHVSSAHKVPEKLLALIQGYNQKEDIVYITVAGRSNGLSGCTAGSSIHPVVACPPFSSKEDMMININSTLQMPSEVPVLTVLDPKNAAYAVVRILALKNEGLREKIERRIEKVKSEF